jgi:hypothetical protein
MNNENKPRKSSRKLSSVLRSLVAVGTTSVMLLAGLAIVNGPAAAAATPHASGSGGPCNASVTAGTGVVVGSLIIGVTAGSSQVTLDCDTSSGAGLAAEVSLLDGVASFGVSLAGEADTSALAQLAASATDTGCPLATAGKCSIGVFSVPAAFSATDPKAVCPPSQAQINAGVFGCALGVATLQDAPLAGAEWLMTYASETTAPNAPTIAATVANGPPSSTITVSDAPANSGYWWANAIQISQAVATGQTPMTQPSGCGAGGGYASVPTAFLEVNWFATASTTAIAGDPSGLSISNDCYDGATLYAPTLSGTVPVPSSVVVGTTYTVYVCELNLTPFASNDPSATTNCGPAPAGQNWVDAQFKFTVASGTAQAALSITSVSGTQGTPITLVTSGGSGSGALSFKVVNGTATGCAITASTLSATTAGTCVVTANHAADTTYLAVSSTPTTITLAALPVVKLVTTQVRLARNAKVLPLKISCTSAKCTGTLNATASVTVRKKKGSKTVTVKETLNFGTGSYSLAVGAKGTVSIHLTAASMSYLRTNPNRPNVSMNVYATSSGSRTHTKTGHVTLMK